MFILWGTRYEPANKYIMGACREWRELVVVVVGGGVGVNRCEVCVCVEGGGGRGGAALAFNSSE